VVRYHTTLGESYFFNSISTSFASGSFLPAFYPDSCFPISGRTLAQVLHVPNSSDALWESRDGYKCCATSIRRQYRAEAVKNKINAGKDSRDGSADDRGRRVASGDLGGDLKREEKREGV